MERKPIGYIEQICKVRKIWKKNSNISFPDNEAGIYFFV